MNPIEFSDKFNNLFYPKKGIRYYIVTGGRFSSKSFSVSSAICTLVNDLGHRVLYTRYTLTSAKDSIIPEFKEKLEMFGVSNYYNEQSDRIESKDGSRKIVFKGIKTSAGNQSAKLKSLKDFSCFVLDEAEEENDEASFDRIDLSIRANDLQNIVALILNPTTKTHWIYKRFFESKNVGEGFNGIVGDTCYIHTTYQDCLKHVPADYLAIIEDMKINNPKKFRHVILGGWLDKAEGVIFTNWTHGEFDESLPYQYGMDFGVFPDPDTLIKIAIDNKAKKIYVQLELYEFNQTTDNLVSRVKAIAGSKLIVADSAGKRSIADLNKEGLNVVAAEKPPGSVKAGIRIVKNYQIVVCGDSSRIVTELNHYVMKDGEPVDAYNHCLDPIRYVAWKFTRPAKSLRIIK